jgi:hypothetical protein
VRPREEGLGGQQAMRCREGDTLGGEQQQRNHCILALCTAASEHTMPVAAQLTAVGAPNASCSLPPPLLPQVCCLLGRA